MKKNKPTDIDWETIENEYRAGMLSIREVARRNGVDHAYLIRTAKKKGWSRDLTEKVKRAVTRKLVTNSVTASNAKDGEIVAAESDRVVQVATLHRADINRLREMEQVLLTELGKNPTKLHICHHQGEIIHTVVAIPVTERAAALNALAKVQHKRITLERTAWNLDEIDRSADKCLIVLN